MREKKQTDTDLEKAPGAESTDPPRHPELGENSRGALVKQMGKLRMRSWHQSITRPEVKPGSFQTGRFASPVPLSLFNSLPWQAPLISSTSSLLSSYPSPHQSSQGDACKTETRAYHSSAQNSSPSLLPNLLPAVPAHMPTLARYR